MSTTPQPGRRKPQQFHLPDGTRVVVALPEDLATLQQRQAALPAEEAAEVILHGSDEHHAYLARTRDHHERAREALRDRHGPAFEEWETVQRRLDEVTRALDRLGDRTSALGASFSKFGFAAHLRTYDDDGDGDERGGGSGSSGAATATSTARRGSAGDASSATTLVDYEDRNRGQTMKLFKRPVIKQYFHKGLIWRASEEAHIMSFELFFDLLYVGIIHVNGEHVAESPDGLELLRFVVCFCMSWKVWTDVTQLISWFNTDDVLQRLEILFLFTCLLGLTTNMIQSFYPDPAHNTYATMVSFYLAASLFQACYCALTGALLPLVRGVMVSQIVVLVLPAGLWIASIHVDTTAARAALVFPALAMDLWGHGVVLSLFRYSWAHGDTPLGRRLARWFDFFPAMNIEHRVERMNAFVALVFGYSVISVLFQNRAVFGLNPFLGRSVLGLCQAFVFNWLYFDVDGANLHVHAIRRGTWSAVLWGQAHLPFVMAYILAAASLSKLVVAADVPGADPHDLTHHYELRSEPAVSAGIRIFYCHGLAVALLCMGAISLSHDHKTPPEMRVPKPWRLANRALVCLVLLLLPLAGARLDSTALIATTLGLVVWVLLLETWGKSCRCDSFWPEECRTRYAARCSRRTAEEQAAKSDKAVPRVETEAVVADRA